MFDSISLAILPTLSAAFVNKKLKKGMGRIYGYIVYFAVALVSPLLFYMIIFSTPFTYSLFGSGFSYAPLYVSILGVGLLLGVAGSYASTLLISDGKVRLVLKYNLIAYFLILLLYLILIPLFGAIGYVLVAFLAGPLLVDLLFITKISKMFGVKWRLKKLFRVVVANLVVSALVFPLYLVLGGFALMIAAALGFLVLYPLLVVLLGGVDKSDLNTIKSLSKSIPIAGFALNLLADYANMVVR